MTRSILTISLLLALLANIGSAQDSQPQDERLAAATEEFLELKARYDKEYNDYIRIHADLIRRGQRQKANKHRRENRLSDDYIAKFVEGAKKYQGTAGAARFLGWVANSTQADKNLSKQAVTILFDEHSQSLWMRNLLSAIGLRRVVDTYGRNGMRKRLALLVENSPHAEVRRPARYILAQGTLLDPEISSDERDAALAELRELGSEDKGDTLAKQARAVVFGIERLQLGMEVPELTGKDLNGRSIRLSDFRGQVVLLEFWADGVVACQASYKHSKSMFKKFAPSGRYAHFGVNCNRDLVDARHRSKEDERPWRNLWNGDEGLVGGPAQLWSIGALPTFYVIDAKGIILSKGLRGGDLEKSINELLVAMGALKEN